MPIYELGYRHWEGTLRPPIARWWAITRTGMALAFRSKILKRILFAAWMPLLYYAPLFFAIGYVTDPTRDIASRGFWAQMVAGFVGEELAGRLLTDPESLRPVAWSMAYHYFFSVFQSFFTMIVVAIVGPPLIAHDVRSKAFLLYFSKPITRWEYLFGKSAVALLYVGLITLAPGLLLYGISIVLSPSIGALAQTSGMIVKIVAASLVIALPSTLIVMCLSSLTGETRFATFAWIAICLIGEVAHALLWEVARIREPWVALLSFRETTRVAIESVLNVRNQLQALGAGADLKKLIEKFTSPCSSGLALGWLAGVCVACLAVLYRRISAPVRI